jgi:hypothetical protein
VIVARHEMPGNGACKLRHLQPLPEASFPPGLRAQGSELLIVETESIRLILASCSALSVQNVPLFFAIRFVRSLSATAAGELFHPRFKVN